MHLTVSAGTTFLPGLRESVKGKRQNDSVWEPTVGARGGNQSPRPSPIPEECGFAGPPFSTVVVDGWRSNRTRESAGQGLGVSYKHANGGISYERWRDPEGHGGAGRLRDLFAAESTSGEGTSS